MNNNTLHIDVRANSLHILEIRKQAEDNLKNALISAVPGIIERQGELPSFITKEYGAYSTLLSEARTCYEFGFFYGAVALICITAEKYSMELLGKVKGTQHQRLNKLKELKVIASEDYERLDKIDKMRLKYIHPRKIEESDAKKDAIEMISLFNKVIDRRFNEKYEIREGVIYEKVTNAAFKVMVP